MKNWRPISLLNTTYKLASSCIAERIKSVLPIIISNDQTGFIPGRYIGENTRLIYDILFYTEVNYLPGLLLLIDFEKAFDSVSWKFINEVLDFFNFGPSIKLWIKTFYTNISSSVSQNCFLSDFFQIQRGCRQGDPLSPYIFLLCAEILGILIRKNKEIKGIKIDDTEYLISQYADDTSIILDGTPESLDASLRLLQKYAEMSGLHMNLDKTKVVWIGKKKYSQDTMCVKWGLEWGSSRFTLLGINFSVNLHEMELLNYGPRIKEIENIIKIWSKQTLTPVGKITIIKTLIISKLNHLFLTLQAPCKNTLKQLTDKIYSFIWENKPDKIKREILCSEHKLGGLKMIDIDKYIKGLKLTWIRRLLKNNPKLNKLLESTEKISIENLVYLGPTKRCKNPFWEEVFKAWTDLQNKFIPKNEEEFLSDSLWNNENIKIGTTSIFYKDWIDKGIFLINDLLNDEGKLMTFQQFQNIYKIKSNFLTYNGVILSIKSYKKALKNYISINNCYKTLGPIMPNNIRIFFLSRKGSKDMYNVLFEKSSTKLRCEEKWSLTLNKNFDWKTVHNMSFYSTKSSKLHWFQYRIIHRILGTNKFLFKIKIKQSDKCTFCSEVTEDIEHIFWTCHKIADLWIRLMDWIYNQTQIIIPFNMDIILFGNLGKTENNKIKNLIILLSKFFIYRTKLCENQVNFAGLKNYLKENLILEKNIFFKTKPLHIANLYWDPWLPLLE